MSRNNSSCLVDFHNSNNNNKHEGINNKAGEDKKRPMRRGLEDPNTMTVASTYANQHIPHFLKLPLIHRASRNGNANGDVDVDSVLQTIPDGAMVSVENIRGGVLDISRPILICDTPESIGIQLPDHQYRHHFHHNEVEDDDVEGRSSNRTNHRPTQAFTIRDLAEYLGPTMPVNVIDVEFQEELDGWTLFDLVEYFEDEERIMAVESQPSVRIDQQRRRGRQQRQAALRFIERTKHRVLNQISLEFSHTRLAEMVRSPRLVRQLDWIDTLSPSEFKQRRIYPTVQYYCLTSAAGSYTDFHIDFGGTSVWYHVVQGSKEFCLIPPTSDNLQVYEHWLCRKDQANVFLAHDITDPTQVVRVALQQHETMIIPAGWIHAVYTPTDSIVVGGNFMHGYDIPIQLGVYKMEVRTKVLERFRFPHFQAMQWYAAGAYFIKLSSRPTTVCLREREGLKDLIRILEEWWNSDPVMYASSNTDDVTSPSFAATYVMQATNCDTVEIYLEKFRELVLRHHDQISQPVDDINCEKFVRSTSSRRTDDNIWDNTTTAVDATSTTGEDTGPANNNNNNTAPKATSFRITLSLAAKKMEPIPDAVIKKIGSTAREDLNSIVNERNLQNDDDWRLRSTTSPSSKSKGSNRRTAIEKGSTGDSTSRPSMRHVSQNESHRNSDEWVPESSKRQKRLIAKNNSHSTAPENPPKGSSLTFARKNRSMPRTSSSSAPATTARQRLLCKIRK